MSNTIADNGTTNSGVFLATRDDASSIMTTVRRAMLEYARNSGIPDGNDGLPLLEAMHDTKADVLAAIENGQILVARRNWQIVGTTQLDIQEDGDICFLRRFSVLPEYMGTGIGKLLFHCAVSHLKARNCREIRLFTAYSNHPVISFYERMGFHIIEVDNFGVYPRALLGYVINGDNESVQAQIFQPTSFSVAKQN